MIRWSNILPRAISWSSLFLVALCTAGTAHSRPLTIDDVLAIQTVDGADISPTSGEIAIAMPRPAAPDEVYGRNSYEIDPSRNDIWLVQRDGTALRRLTNGQPDAAAYWCPHWNADGNHLAMLSTAPQGNEPRGGDNARLYVWDRGSKSPRRLSARAIMTQTRYGGPLNEIDLRAARKSSPEQCRANDENAPFVWLDETRLLAVLMPEGENSAFVDRYAKYHREAARAGAEIRAGEIATVSRSDSPGENPTAYRAELVVFDVADGSQTTLGWVPAFPMFGALTIALSPDGARAAVLAPRRAIPQHLLASPRLNFATWEIENTLLVANLLGDVELTEISLPAEASFPVDLGSWSPDSRYLTLRARGDTSRNAAELWALDAEAGTLEAMAPGEDAGPLYPQRGPADYAFWSGDGKLMVKAAKAGGEGRWRSIDVAVGKELAFSSGIAGLSSPRQLADGSLVAKSADSHVRYASDQGQFVDWPSIDVAGCTGPAELVTRYEGDVARYALWTIAGPLDATVSLDPATQILDHDCTGLVVAQHSQVGSVVRFVPWDGKPANLMERNTHLAAVERGERRMIDYTHANGSAQKMAVLFPPDYDPAKSYPTLFWVYGRHSPSGVDDYFLDPQMPGFYNLDLYAGQGYVVVIPSIPIPRGDAPSESFAAIPGGVLPALDKLIELGITDAARAGVFGHSYGGFTVNALVAQTDRFAAAASLSAASDLATAAASFDPTARGWRGAEQDMAFNQGIYESGLNFKVDPGTDPALYHRNSPLTYVDQIVTPLLIIHGELDVRAPLTQAETLYSLLHRRGRPARLLRYWGENHSLANSPANVRDISRELLAWFDRHLRSRTEED